jgi:hypothetical protein
MLLKKVAHLFLSDDESLTQLLIVHKEQSIRILNLRPPTWMLTIIFILV